MRVSSIRKRADQLQAYMQTRMEERNAAGEAGTSETDTAEGRGSRTSMWDSMLSARVITQEFSVAAFCFR